MQEQRTKRITLREIAAETGFSVNTVSKALRDTPDLSKPTKQLIQETANRMGYVANDAASSLRSGISNVLALIISDISNPFYGILCKEIELQAAKHHVTVIVFNTEEDPDREERAIRTALSKNVDGVLLAPSQHRTDGLRLLQEHGKPFVLIGRYFDDFPVDAVLYDDEQGGYLAGTHLIECGCRNLVMVNPPRTSSARNRAKGFIRAIEEAGSVKSRFLTIDSPIGGMAEALKQAYTEDPFDGLFTFSDLLALEAACVLQDLGIQPGTVKQVGFDDIQSRLAFPLPLTTISAGKAAFGEALVSLLMKRISGDRNDYPKQIVLPSTLVIRSSTSLK